MQNFENPHRTLQSAADGLMVKAQAPISDVQAQIEYLEGSIAKLDAVGCNLLARLSPVLSPCSDPSDTPGPARAIASTELAVQISTLASRVDSVRGALADAHGRLGI